VPSGIGVLTLDRDLRIQSWNHWLVTATGLTEAAVRGRRATEFAPPARTALLHEVFTEVVEYGTTRVLSAALHHCLIACPPRTASRHFREMQQKVTVAPLRSADGIVGIIVTVEDVTERLAAERERAEQGNQTAPSGERNLVSDAGAEDWRVRAAATRALKETATREQVAELLVSLERDHQNFSVLSGALDVLVAVNRDVAGPIIQLLGDPSPNLRMHAALALGNIGGTEVVSALIRALDDDDANVRFHVIESLGRLGVAEAVGPLTRVATSGDFFLAFPAIDALGKIDDAGVLPVLVSLLDEELLRPAIVDALSTLGDEDCVAPLASFINDGRGDTAAIASAIERIAARYEATLGDGEQIIDLTRRSLTPEGNARVCQAVQSRLQPLRGSVTVAGWLGPQCVPAVMSVIDVPDLREEVSTAMTRLGRDAVAPLLDVLATGSREARIAAAGFLGAIGDRSATQPLMEILSSHDTELVVAAVGALGTIRDPVSLDAIARVFAHPDAVVRQGALAAVQSIGDERVKVHVLAALDSDDSRIRECGVRAAGYFGFEDCAERVVGALADSAEDVRRAAIEQLPLLADGRGEGLLVTALRSETGRNRAAAAHALRSMQRPGLEPALIAALRDEDPWVRYFAAGSLDTHGTAACVSDLTELARADRAPHVRIAALAALGGVAPSALSEVAPSMVDDPDEDVAAAAVTALAYVHGADADVLLAAAIRGASAAMRLAATDALTQRGTPEAVAALEWAAQLSDPPALSALAMDGLRRIADSSDLQGRHAAIAALLALAGDPAHRDQVIVVLGALSPAASGLLRDAARDSRPAVRVAVIEALARMRDTRASQIIADALADDAPAVRSAAVAALGRLGSSIARRAIVAMSASDPNLAVRRVSAAVCRRQGWASEPPRDGR
jgi:PAS domain S-box-containing protein